MASQLKRAVRSARRTRSSRFLAPVFEQLEGRQLLSGMPSPSALTPAEVRSYYGFNSIEFQSFKTITIFGHRIELPVLVPGDGTGQTIAIVVADVDPNIASDLAAFDKQFHLPAANLTVDPLTTATDPTGHEEAEESLDVEWAHAMAPGANIVVVNRVNSIQGLLNAIDVAKNYPGVSVVSTSTGFGESSGEAADESYFTNPSNHGGINVSFVTASGDDKTGLGPGPLLPSALPNVLAVGGTVLTVSSSGDTETSWQDSEGGQSAQLAEPRYQELVQQTGFRTTPDVAFAATNYPVYDTFPYLSSTTNQLTILNWSVGDGTSFGAPEWAGLLAIANQGRALEGKPTLSDMPQVLYTLPSTDFNDITTGPADREGNQPGPGYDEITGLGSPKANLIVQGLVNPPFFIFPPFLTSLAISGGHVTGPGSSPQVEQDEFGLEDSSSQPLVGATIQAAGSTALSASPVTGLSSAPIAENSAALQVVSGAPATFTEITSAGWTTQSQTGSGTAPVNDSSSLPLSRAAAGPVLSDTSAAPISFRFADQHGDGVAFPGTNLAGQSDPVPANAVFHDHGSPQTASAGEATSAASAALFTQSIDSFFVRRGWNMDAIQSQVPSGTAAGRPREASGAFAVTAGIVSAWVVRRRLRKARRGGPDETQN